MELIARQSGVKFTHVPFKGGGEVHRRRARRARHDDGGIAGVGAAWSTSGQFRLLMMLDGRAQQEVARHADAEGAGLHLRVRFARSASPARRAWTRPSSRSCTTPSRLAYDDPKVIEL